MKGHFCPAITNQNTQAMKEEKEISFIAERYRKGKFSVEKGWNRLGIAPSYKMKRMRVAAAVASAVVLSAAAAIVWQNYHLSGIEPAVPVEEVAAPEKVVKVIDFEDASLPMVISKIKDLYGVEVVNIPENAGQYKLSLHYEGNAEDLVNTINEILETQMKIAK